MRARYAHTNLIARDWRRLSDFYVRVFGCVPVPPERDYRSAELDRGTGLSDAHLTGAHLRLPGHGDAGPTLEVFSYDDAVDAPHVAVNQRGFGHVAFEVDDVCAAREEVLREGGEAVGEVVALTTANGGRVTWCYVRDIEGNIVELQSWG
ncbi:MAG: VOC family protein [Polyangiaceae bacterium]